MARGSLAASLSQTRRQLSAGLRRRRPLRPLKRDTFSPDEQLSPNEFSSKIFCSLLLERGITVHPLGLQFIHSSLQFHLCYKIQLHSCIQKTLKDGLFKKIHTTNKNRTKRKFLNEVLNCSINPKTPFSRTFQGLDNPDLAFLVQLDWEETPESHREKTCHRQTESVSQFKVCIF